MASGGWGDSLQEKICGVGQEKIHSVVIGSENIHKRRDSLN